MSKLISSLNIGTGLTNNGAITHISSLNNCLDLFFNIGAARKINDKGIISMFSKAYIEDKHKALKILFWARDIRSGAGERRVFRVILEYLIYSDLNTYQSIIEYIPMYGRWDDLFFNEKITKYSLDYIRDTIIKEDGSIGLLFKWLPREKSSNRKIAKLIRNKLEMSPKEYRNLLVRNSTTVENKMCNNEWKLIDYNEVPSKAFNIYSKAFVKHDSERFTEFLESDSTVNAGAIFPVDIYKSFLNNKPSIAINAQWANLPNYMNDDNVMAVCDTSGSMTGEPIEVSISLGVYISERTTGIFKNHFITFEGVPRLQGLSGKPTDRFAQIKNCYSDCSTNLQGVFELIIEIAKRDNLSQEDMPSKLILISDMEFNQVARTSRNGNKQTNFEAINEMYIEAGYKRPTLIFWNVFGRGENFPIQSEDKDTALVSGYSPSILKSVLGGKDLTPLGVMNEAISKYCFIDKLII